MSHVTIVEIINLKIILGFLLRDIIKYKKNKLIDYSQFSFLAKFLGQK